MIIDSHAHYTHKAFAQTFSWLAYDGTGYSLEEGTRARLLERLSMSLVAHWIEPGISLASCEDILRLEQEYPGRLFPAMGVHPTRTMGEAWAHRRRLARYADTPGVVAIGETGLDYHFPRRDQHRLRQHLWFLYQLNLARKKNLPVILHIRDAHEAALKILRHHPARKLGGVVHCFHGPVAVAEAYLSLGYHLGIGGAILQPEQRARELWEVVAQTPLNRILLETDAPFILPACGPNIPSRRLRRARNTSLILPAVAARIAELKQTTPELVEQATTENAIRLFRLPCGNPEPQRL